MEKEFVNYKQALALKELGFDVPINAIWLTNANSELQLGFGSWINSNKSPDYLSAPLKQQVFRWFREKYFLYHVIHQFKFKKDTDEEYLAEVNNTDDGFSYFRTYEEAEFFCIDKLIEIVKNK